MSLINPATFAALKELAGDDLLNDLIDAFLEDAPRMITAMQAGVAAPDIDAVRRNAHSMKSNAEIFGATDLAVLAREVESRARAGDLDLGGQIADLQASYRAAAEELRGLRR